MRERQVLDVFAAHRGSWLVRSELAKILGRKRLNQGDFEALAALQAKQLIEIEKRPAPGPIGYVTYYRLPEGA